MATLRNFQNEIEDIHHREVAKQRSLASREHEKENRNPANSGKNGRVGKESVEDAEADSDTEKQLIVRIICLTYRTVILTDAD